MKQDHVEKFDCYIVSVDVDSFHLMSFNRKYFCYLTLLALATFYDGNLYQVNLASYSCVT